MLSSAERHPQRPCALSDTLTARRAERGVVCTGGDRRVQGSVHTAMPEGTALLGPGWLTRS